jgi:hypothetical protein
MSEPPSKEAVAVMGLFSLSKNSRTTGANNVSSASSGDVVYRSSSSENSAASRTAAAAGVKNSMTNQHKSDTDMDMDEYHQSQFRKKNTDQGDDTNPTESFAAESNTATGFDVSNVANNVISTSSDGVKVHAHDILSGRGNGANQHSGNIYFRNLICQFKRKYILSEPAIKKQITSQVFHIVRAREPPGRFLRQKAKSGEWTELDRETALRKTAQALREKAPELKKEVLAEAERKDEQRMMKRIKRNHPHAIVPPSVASMEHAAATAQSSVTLARKHHQEQQQQQQQKGFQYQQPASPPPVASSPPPQHPVQQHHRHQDTFNSSAAAIAAGRYRAQEEQVLKESIALEQSHHKARHHRQQQQQQHHNNAILRAAAVRTSGDSRAEMQQQQQQHQVQHMSPADIARLAMLSAAAESSNILFQSNSNNVTDNAPVILNDAHFMGKTASLNPRQDEIFNQLSGHSIQQQSHESGTSLAYAFNYETVSITCAATGRVNSGEVKTAREGSGYYETLKNISIVASTSPRDLTALYVIVRMSSDALAFASFEKNCAIKPTVHDIVVDAKHILNHPGNLYLAELIQTHRPEYSNARFSNEELRLKILDHTSKCITKEGSNLSKADPKRGRFLLCESDKAGKHKWRVLPSNKILAMMSSLFDQACIFILAPETNDVLFGKFDRAMISPGNMFYKMIVAKCRPLYVQSTPDRRSQYPAEIVGFITSRPGRFLGYCQGVGMWMPLPFELAIEKTQEMLDNDSSDFIALAPDHPSAQMGNVSNLYM